MKYNKIHTIEEEMAMGFTREEAILDIEHDILYNKCVDGVITEEEKERMFEIIDILKI